MVRTRLLLIVFLFNIFIFNQQLFAFNDIPDGDVELVKRVILFNFEECIGSLEVYKEYEYLHTKADCKIKYLDTTDLPMRPISESRQFNDGSFISLFNLDRSGSLDNINKVQVKMAGGALDRSKSKFENTKIIEAAFNETWPEGIKSYILKKKTTTR